MNKRKEDNPELIVLGRCSETPGSTGPDTDFKTALLCNKQVTRALVQLHSQEQFASLEPFHTLLLFLVPTSRLVSVEQTD